MRHSFSGQAQPILILSSARRSQGACRRTQSAKCSGSSCAVDGHHGDALLYHPDVLELPGVVTVEILRKEPPAILQGRPVAPHADDIAEIGPADLQHPCKIQLL